MKIVRVRVIPMSDPVPPERRHRTDLGTKMKSDATLILVETDNGLIGMGAALGTPPVVAAIVEHELAPELIGEDPMFSERIFEKMYNGSRAGPALERGVAQAETSRRNGMVMEAISGIDIAIWDVKAKALGIPIYQALGAVRRSVRGYASGGWAPGNEAEAELGGYAAKGFTAVKMRVVGRDGFSIENCVRRVAAARRGIGPNVELMVDAHASLETPVAMRLAKALEPYNIAWFEEPVSPDNHAGMAEVSFDAHPDRFGRARIFALWLSQPAGAQGHRHRAAGCRARRRPHRNPPHRRAHRHARYPSRAACVGRRRVIRRQHSRCNVGSQLPHPRSQSGLHADDERAF